MSHSESVSYQFVLFCFLSLFNQCVLVVSRDFSEVDSQSVRHRYISRTWSDWTPWSTCSRTCGGGVRQRTRTCKVRMVGYRVSPDTCMGDTTDYELCSRQACSSNEDFLQFQCSKRNGQVVSGRPVNEWIPFRYGKNPCELQCWARNRSVVYGFGKVVDGTPCPSSDPRDPALCVNGRCTPVDCAGQFGTDNRRDICGVCRGENTTCVKYQNTFWRRPRSKLNADGKKDRHYDYNEIFRIPAGATHIKATLTSDKNFLALLDHKGNYLINGNWRIQSPGRFIVHGSEFIYNRTLDGLQELSSAGPTRFIFIVLVLGSGDIPTVHYEYWISTASFNSESHFQHPSVHVQTLEPFPPKYPYDSELMRPFNNAIETSSLQTKALPTKFQGYKSYYHRNEILKSVPSWSVKRHRSRKHPINRSIGDAQNDIGTEKWRNLTDDSESHLENPKWRDGNRKATVLPIVKNITNATVVPLTYHRALQYINPIYHSNDYGRPNGTSAFTRSNHVFPRTDSKEKQVAVELESNRSSMREDGSEVRRSKKKQKSKGKGDDSMRLKRKRKSDKGECPSCPRIKHQTRSFCESDFVLRAVVLSFEKQQQGIRFEMEVTRSFKNKVPILSREYIWTPDTCLCPKLRVGKEYILMGHSSIVGGKRESKLVVDRTSFVRQYSQKRAKTMLRLVRDQSRVCRRLNSGIKFR